MAWGGGPNTFTFDYNALGLYNTITFPNGQTREFAYDDQGRLMQIANRHPWTGEIATFAYSYDFDWNSNAYSMLGQRTSVTVTGPGSAFRGSIRPSAAS